MLPVQKNEYATNMMQLQVVSENVLSFTESDGLLRVVLATVVFAMGLDAPNIQRSCHWDPPTNVATYFQESGRIGREQWNNGCP